MQSDQLHEVKLALDMLDTADHPSLPDHLLQLADNPNPEVQIEGLMRIEARQLRAALPLVTELVETSGNTEAMP